MQGRFLARARAEREREILSAAENQLAARGCLSFSVDAVAAEAGVAKGTIYNHFSRREDLISGVLQETAARSEALLAEVLAANEEHGLALALVSFAEQASAQAHADSNDRFRLPYPCCLQLVRCPYAGDQSVLAQLAHALENASAAHSPNGGWTTEGARWITLLLSDLLLPREEAAPTGDRSDREMVLDFLRQGLS